MRRARAIDFLKNAEAFRLEATLYVIVAVFCVFLYKLRTRPPRVQSVLRQTDSYERTSFARVEAGRTWARFTVRDHVCLLQCGGRVCVCLVQGIVMVQATRWVSFQQPWHQCSGGCARCLRLRCAGLSGRRAFSDGLDSQGPCRPLVSVSDLVAYGKDLFSEVVWLLILLEQCFIDFASDVRLRSVECSGRVAGLVTAQLEKIRLWDWLIPHRLLGPWHKMGGFTVDHLRAVRPALLASKLFL